MSFVILVVLESKGFEKNFRKKMFTFLINISKRHDYYKPSSLYDKFDLFIKTLNFNGRFEI